MNIELIKKINNIFEISDGYIIVENYDKENNILLISENAINNNKLLYGKIVKFDMKLNDIIDKINNIEECKFKNKTINYTLDTIWSNKSSGGTYKAYIIY
jgi:hypothetical protein